MAKALVPWRGKTDPQPPAKREDLHDPFVTFRREVNRMFDDVFSGVFDGFGSRALSPFFGSWSEATPTMDVEETEREIVISAELPGLDHKDFEVIVSGDVLTLKGEKKEERGDAHQESDQLVEPAVPGGDKNSRQIIHEGRILRRDTSSAPRSARAEPVAWLLREAVPPMPASRRAFRSRTPETSMGWCPAPPTWTIS